MDALLEGVLKLLTTALGVALGIYIANRLEERKQQGKKGTK